MKPFYSLHANLKLAFIIIKYYGYHLLGGKQLFSDRDGGK